MFEFIKNTLFKEEIKQGGFENNNYKILFEKSPVGIIHFGMNNKIIDINPFLIQLTGYNKKDLIGKSVIEMIRIFKVNVSSSKIINLLNGFIKTSELPVKEWAIVDKKGIEKIIKVNGQVLKKAGKPVGFFAIIEDITKKKEEEWLLKENKIKFGEMLENAPLGILYTNFNGKIIYNNTKSEFFFNSKKLFEKNLFKLNCFSKEDGEKIKELFNTLKTGKTESQCTVFINSKKNNFFVEIKATPIMYKGEKSLLVLINDLSKIKESQKKLNQSEKKFRAIVENAADGIIIADVKTRKFVDGNKEICRMLGYSIDEIKNLKVDDIHPKKDLKNIIKQFEKQVKKEVKIAENLPVLRKDKSVFYADVNSFPIELEEGKFLIGIFRDITQKRNIAKEKDNLHKLFSKAEQVAHIGSWEMDIKTGKSIWSDEFFRICGFKPQEFEPTAKKGFKVIHPDDRKKAEKAVNNSIKTGKPYDVVKRIVRPNGEIRWVKSVGKIEYENKEPVKLIGSFLDITEQKNAEFALAENEEKYRLISENTSDIIVLLKPDSTILYVNKSVEKTGYTFKDLVGKKALTLLDKKTASDLLKNISLKSGFETVLKWLKNKNEKLVYEFVGKNGKIFHFESEIKLIKQDKGFLSLLIARDVSKRKKYENDLKKYIGDMKKLNNYLVELVKVSGDFDFFNFIADKIHEFVPNSHIIIDEYIPEKNLLEIKTVRLKNNSSKFEKNFSKRVIGLKFGLSDSINKELRSNEFVSFSEKTIKKYAKNVPLSVLKLLFKTFDDFSMIGLYEKGKLYGVVTFISKKGIDNKEMIKTFVNLVSIALEKNNSELNVKQSEEKFRKFFENQSEYCYMVSPTGLILDVNKSALKFLGYKKDELLGKPLKMIYSPSYLEKAKLIFEEWKEKGSVENKNMKIVSKTGEIKEVLLSVDAVKDDSGKILHSISVQRDITESSKLSELENERKAEKVRKDFLMLITHELKQPLTPILGYADLLKEKSMDVDTLKYLDRIISGAETMHELINKIVNLMKLETGQLVLNYRSISLSNLINEVIIKKASLMNLKNIEVVKKIKEVTFEADNILLRDLLLNLLDNAVKFSEDNSKIEIIGESKNNNVIISVKDFGEGIPKEDVSKLFKTFSQTIEGRKRGGFGLGLSLCKMIVEKHKGTISVKSKVGKGSTFIVKLPLKP